MAKQETAQQVFERWMKRGNNWSTLLIASSEAPCVKTAVVQKYIEIKKSKTLNKHAQQVFDSFNPDIENDMRDAANVVWRNNKDEAIAILKRGSECLTSKKTTTQYNKLDGTSSNIQQSTTIYSSPFDRRLDRLEQHLSDNKINNTLITPYDVAYAEVATSGYLIGEKPLRDLPDNDEGKKRLIELRKSQYEQMKKDDFYVGVPALQNTYALVRLYGSEGGKKLLNQKGQRRWYEVDTTSDQAFNFASAPTTSALISWGLGDPYGRTPYHFTDFVFCKYWKKIENNRLITLRRYAAPILDNLKFPGMGGNTDAGTSKVSVPGKQDQGSYSQAVFPPMASAVTYFGGDTGNSLNNILKFTTGVLWDDVQAAVWEVQTDSVPENVPGGGLYGGLTKFAEMLNVAGGHFDRELIMNQGHLPPDPYVEGPYENRIQGPVNRIDSVKKRKPGLAFQWDGLNIVFEYVARPVGGINPKAVLLDILSNFLVIGSASAVFFGGAHRFMADPAKYPFLGSGKGMEKWYRGDPVGWSLEAIKDFTGDKGTAAGSNFLESAKAFLDQLLSGEKGSGLGSILSSFSTGATKNIINNQIAKKTAGQIPYLRGLKAVLTGEAIGEWHVTVGNPLNPIAMIGNLVCDGIDVEFNEELGPDDFPTEMKITVKLKHAMARDRDAIESVFNRGMGRIYSLPESYLGSADFQTTVDKYTESDMTGTMPDRRFNVLYRPGLDSGFISPSQIQGKQSVLGGEVSVWNRASFNVGMSENTNVQLQSNEIYRSAYRTADWIAQRSLQ